MKKFVVLTDPDSGKKAAVQIDKIMVVADGSDNDAGVLLENGSRYRVRESVAKVLALIEEEST